ncbi:hypothetical protein A6A08_16490 [Nocardiopsis sp. TSRI0078]|uniref:hypothetical protein n=1 Tax=unclassified Nocardiopsis TaxID=2649073 RepID=UPI00093FC1BD|nr:hypothetical protein [Nocardiopsis sp. TSRI0078]OKI13037.1 hypothetical protein A6A08_16490 [Nocardiopsis sp. TSRI0078]
MEWPTLGWLFGILVAIAVPIALIFLVLWIIRRETIRKQEAVRSPDYWKERPEGRRYPTGWDRSPDLGSPRPGEGVAQDDPTAGEDRKPPPEGGDPPVR